MNKALSLVDIIEQLPDTPVGTLFEADYGSEFYVGTQTEPQADSQKVLKWKSNDRLVGITEVTVGATYHLIPDYIQIGWQEAFEMIKEAIETPDQLLTGVFIESDGGFQEINALDDFEEDLYIEDFLDLFRMKFYKSNK
ncbi:hypothetical protein EG103P1_00029 [Enterococcus phage EG103P1]|nr:hypothetical protein EG103P1_00029 [Enterococcus phage EG103P1]